MMLNNYLVSINNVSDIEKYKKVGITTFLFALKDYSIGYENTYSIEDINQINESKYVLINALLTSKDIDNLKLIISNLNVDGIIFEDVGLINIINELKMNVKKILYMNHFNCNSASVNTWLQYCDSVILSSELTLEEYKYIVNNVKHPIVLNVFGYNEIMYSKRQLLSNYYKKFNVKGNKINTIEDQVSHIKFHLVETDLGTIALSEHIFNGSKLLDLNNVLYYYLNTSFISTDDVIKFINDETVSNTDEGFLNTPTIYKLRGDNK